MYYAYLDESGQTDQDGRTFLCGFLGNETQWREAARLWGPAIHPRKILHVQDLRFKHRHRIEPLLARAGAIPDKAGLTPVGTSVKFSDYSDIFTRQEARIGGAYIQGLYGAVLSAVSLVPRNERLSLVLGSQDTWEPLAQLALQDIATDTVPGRIASWSFVPASQCSIMGLADYYCFAKLQEARDPTSLKAVLSKPILSCNGGEIHCMAITRDESRQLAIELKELMDEYIARRSRSSGRSPEEIWDGEKTRREAYQATLLNRRKNKPRGEHPDCAKWRQA